MVANDAWTEVMSTLLFLSVSGTLALWGDYGYTLWTSWYPHEKMKSLEVKFLFALAVTIVTVLLYRYYSQKSQSDQ